MVHMVIRIVVRAAFRSVLRSEDLMVDLMLDRWEIPAGAPLNHPDFANLASDGRFLRSCSGAAHGPWVGVVGQAHASWHYAPCRWVGRRLSFRSTRSDSSAGSFHVTQQRAKSLALRLLVWVPGSTTTRNGRPS